MKNILCIFCICLLSFTAFSDSMLDAAIAKVLDTGWQVSECYYGECDSSKIDAATRDYELAVENCAELIFNRNLHTELKEKYNEMDEYHKGLLNPVIDLLRKDYISKSNEYGADGTPFPGYGYPEPGFNYRRGKELNREMLSQFWREEERSLETNQENELTIELKFLADFTNGIKNEGKGEVKSMENVNIKVNGELKQAVKIKYSIKKALRVRCKVRFQKTKVWFELFKQKKAPWYAPWQNNAWEICGKTYNIVEEATTDVVASDFDPNDEPQM